MAKSAKSLFSGAGGGCAASGRREWAQIYSIYGSDEWQSVLFLLLQSFLSGAASLLLLLFSGDVLLRSRSLLPSLPPAVLRSSVALLGSSLLLLSVCLLAAAAGLLHSSSALRREVSQRMVASVPDWSSVRTALDVRCGRGLLLSSIARQLKKQGARGRVVGLLPSRAAALSALRRAAADGVHEYVTCREGHARSLPFPDAHFDVVASAASLGDEAGRGLGEMVRVLRPGGVGVVWDLRRRGVPDLAHRLREMRMDEVRVSERLAACLAASHIVSFRKPLSESAATAADWRTNIY
ncbi:putative basic proline-rich protein-like [Iris pallida]|uniref:Basic proline-rich protein-like n=1 Tax=Iris pallida TaxID=29817 RepID=A0AAX6HA75_IRIPA|nr:putative basic proline-rich protein-like [Iris pallida]